RGYRHIKLHERTPEAVAAARQVTGPDIPLMVDTNCAWTAAEAEAAVAAMAPYKPFWIEEPIYPPEDFEALAKLRAVTGVPVGIGENATSLRDFKRMVTIGRADYVQPSMVKLGITAMAKVAAEVEQAGATCVPNAFYLGPRFSRGAALPRDKGERLSARTDVRRFRRDSVRQDRACDPRRS
ncbi:MAG: enolase C-terminal domain-like protein, partial [Candidatus Binatia bacterium]